jgi:hypothetical protein
MTPPASKTVSSDIPNLDAPVTVSVASPAGMTPPEKTNKTKCEEELASPMPSVPESVPAEKVTIDKPPNPILEPSDKLRISDNVLEVTLKLTNPTEQRICFNVGTNANDNQRYSTIHCIETLGPYLTTNATVKYIVLKHWVHILLPKEARSISFTLRSFKRNNFFIIRTMYAPNRQKSVYFFENKDQWDGVWREAIKLGLMTYNRLECVFEAKPEPPVSEIMPTPAVTSTSVKTPTPAVMTTPVVTSTSAVTSTSVITPIPAPTPAVDPLLLMDKILAMMQQDRANN